MPVPTLMLITLLKHGIRIDIEHNAESGAKIGEGKGARKPTSQTYESKLLHPMRLSYRIHAESDGWQHWTL